MNKLFLFGIFFLCLGSVYALPQYLFNGSNTWEQIGDIINLSNTNLTYQNDAYNFSTAKRTILNYTEFTLMRNNSNWSVDLYYNATWSGSRNTLLRNGVANDIFIIEHLTSTAIFRVCFLNTTACKATSKNSVVSNDSYWHLLTVTYNTNWNGVVELWIDGVNQSASGSDPTLTSSTGFVLGMATLGNYYYGGQLDDIRIYNTTLTATEILARNSSGRDAPLTDCVTPYEDVTYSTNKTLCNGLYNLNDNNHNGVFQVTGNNVTIDLNGSTLYRLHPDDTSSIGVYSFYSDITIKNGKLINYGLGADFPSSSRNIHLINVSIINASNEVVYWYGGSGHQAINLSVSCLFNYGVLHAKGIHFKNTLNALAINNSGGWGCEAGIYAQYHVNGFNFSNNVLNGTDRGLRIENSYNGLIYNNHVINSTAETDSYSECMSFGGEYPYTPTYNVSVYKNNCTDTNETGITVQGYAENLTFYNNLIVGGNATKNNFRYDTNREDVPCAYRLSPMRISYFQPDLNGQNALAGGTNFTVYTFGRESLMKNIFINDTVQDYYCLMYVQNVINLTHNLSNYVLWSFQYPTFLENGSNYYIKNESGYTLTGWEGWGTKVGDPVNRLYNFSMSSTILNITNAQPDMTATGQPFGLSFTLSNPLHDVRNGSVIMSSGTSSYYNVTAYTESWTVGDFGFNSSIPYLYWSVVPSGVLIAPYNASLEAVIVVNGSTIVSGIYTLNGISYVGTLSNSSFNISHYNLTVGDYDYFLEVTDSNNVSVNISGTFTVLPGQIVVISPTSGENISQFLNITWTEAISGVQYHNITLPGIFSILTSNETSFTEGGGACSTNGCLVANHTITTSNREIISGTGTCSYTTGDGAIYATAFYDDGTSVSIGGCSYYSGPILTLDNPYPNKQIMFIEYRVSIGIPKSTQLNYVIYSMNNPATDNSLIINLFNYLSPPGTYNLTVSAFDVNDSFIVNGTSAQFNILTNAILNLSVVENITGAAIASFNVEVSSLSDPSDVRNYNTSSGYINIPSIQGTTYNLFVYSPTYAFGYLNVSVNASLTNVTMSLFPENTLNINIYDELNGSLINSSTQVNTYSSSSSHSYTTLNGSLYILGLDPDNYTLSFVNAGYNVRNYLVEVTNGSYQLLNAYLLGVTYAQNFSVTFYNPQGSVVSGVHVKEYVLTNTSYVLIAEEVSDMLGVVRFSFYPLFYYKIVYSAEGFQSDYAYLFPPQPTNYDISLFYPVIPVTTTPQVTGSTYFDNSTDILSFSYVALAQYNVSYYTKVFINGESFILCNDSSILPSATFSCLTTGYTGQAFVGAYANGTSFFGQFVNIGQGISLGSVVNWRDGLLLGFFVVLLSLLVGVMAGPIGAVIFQVLGLVAVFWLGLAGFISVTLIVVDMVVTLIIGLKVRA